MQKLTGSVDHKLNSIIEKLSDYCEDKVQPSRQPFLTAKFKKETPKLPAPAAPTTAPILSAQTVSVMPPAPEHSFAKRIAAQAHAAIPITLPIPDKGITGTGKQVTPLKGSHGDTGKSPPHGAIPSNGPVKILTGFMKAPK